MSSKIITYLGLIMLSLASCVDQLDFPLPDEQPNLLIVDGFVSNLPGPHTVRLTRTAPFRDVTEGGEEKAVNDATVEIYDMNNNRLISLQRSDNLGRYQTPQNFQGEVGNSYQLRIRLADGVVYESDMEELPEPGIIDSIYFGYNSRPVLSNGTIIDNFAVEGSVDYRFRATGVTYYLWDWEGTYHFEPSADDICYVTEEGKSFSSLTDNEETTVQEVKNEAVMFEQEDFRFFEKFNFRAVQYAATKKIYNYFELIREQDQATGTVFDPTPATIFGNIKNVTNSDEVVLGYFAAFGITDKRIFIRRADIPVDILSPSASCARLYPPKWCSDCLCYPGSTDVEPDFWE